MDDADLALRNATYRMFVESGRAPSAETVASATGRAVDDVLPGWGRLHDEHALVVQSDGREIRMANPCSAVPTAYRVLANERWWFWQLP